MTYNMAQYIRSLHAEKPVVDLLSHGIVFRGTEGLVAVLSPSRVHAVEDGSLVPIDLMLVESNGRYKAAGLPVEFLPNGETGLIGRAYREKIIGVGLLDEALSSYVELERFVSSARQNHSMIGDFGSRYQLVREMTATGYKNSLVIDSLPSNLSAGYFVVESQILDMSFPVGQIGSNGVVHNKAKIRRGTAWDSSGRTIDLDVIVIDHPSPVKKSMYWGVPVAWLDEAVFPVTIDPIVDTDAESSGDFTAGYVNHSDTVWADARGSSPAASTESTSLVRVGTSFATGTYNIWRSLVAFNTAILRIGEVLQANMDLTMVDDQWIDQVNFNVNVIYYDWGNDAPINTPNNDTLFQGVKNGTLGALVSSTSGWTNDVTKTSANILTSAISHMGHTFFGLQDNTLDRPDSAPIDRNWADFYTPSEATASYRPILTLDYIPRASVGPRFFS